MAQNHSNLGRFSVLGVGAALLLATSVALLPPLAHADTTPLPIDAYGGTELAQAEQSGTPVVVASQTTESSQVTAEPDGTFQLTSYRGPVRAMTASGWQAIDTTLHTNSDGTFSPNVTTTPVSFSGGGSTLLVSMGTSQQGIKTYWPTALPAPIVSGSSTTYPNVRPNVNLVLTAVSDGFSESLVVGTPAAAQDLANNPIPLNAQGEGVTISQLADGTIVGTDSRGNQVFGGPAPAAWDSSVNKDAPSMTSNVLQSGNAILGALGKITQSVSGGTNLNVTVPTSLLNNPAVQYPIYVDPTLGTEHWVNWETVESGGWNYGGSSTEPMRVGYCGWSGCTSVEGNARSYLEFDTRALGGKPTTAKVFTATVSAFQNWSAASNEPVDLTEAGSFTNSITYPGPITNFLESQASNCGLNGAAGCYVNFQNSNVISYLQSAANHDWSDTNFSLSAPAQNNAYYWKKFASHGNEASLVVTYDFPPSTPTSLTVVGAVTCTSTNYVNTSTPTLEAKSTSYDGEQVGLTYEVKNSAGTVVATSPAIYVNGNGTYYAPWKTPTLADGSYTWLAQAQDNSPNTANETSGWSAPSSFTVDTNHPTKPGLSSFQYPQGYWGATAGTPNAFTFSSPGATGFTYNLDGSTIPQPVCGSGTAGATSGQMLASSSGTATFTIPTSTMAGLPTGYHTLYVGAYDAAHNVTAADPYVFYIAPTLSSAQGSNLVEAEGLNSTIQPGIHNTGTPTYSVLNPCTCSQNSASQISTTHSGDTYTYTLNPSGNTTNVPVAGYYAVGVQLATGSQDGSLTFDVNGQAATKDVTDYTQLPPQTTSQTITVDTGSDPTNPSACRPSMSTSTVFVPLGGFHLDPTQSETLTVHISQGVCGSGALTSQIDDIILAPLNTAGNGTFQASLNNLGIGTAGLTTTPQANLDGSSADNALSSADLAAIDPNFTSGGTYQPWPSMTPNPISFKLPSWSSGADNIIATGQSIGTFDANGNPTGTLLSAPGSYGSPGYVDFLVASTCGPLTQASWKNFSFTYSDGHKPTPNVPPVPAWTDKTNPTLDPGVAIAISPANYLTGTSSPKSTAGPVHLYVIQVPWDPNESGQNITAITLPRVGTDFTGACDATNNALHVFAFAASASPAPGTSN